MIVCLFGFYRNAAMYSHNIKDKIYIFTPTIKNEGLNDPVTSDMISSRYNNFVLQLYDYNKQLHIDKANALSIQKFNKWYQQPYRIFSFFYHIKHVLSMVTEDDVILLTRIDIGLNIHYEKITPLLQHYDVILGSPLDDCGTDDKWFIFNSKHKHVFMSLYDDYSRYLVECSDLPSTRPEDVFLYHIKKNNLSFIHTDVIKYHFNHVCSPYCGHHGIHTLT